jgi:murein L,D-transpeptidase YafK
MNATRRTLAFVLCLGIAGGVRCERHARNPPQASAKASLVIVAKAKRTLSLYAGGRAIRTYHVALGTNPVGPKRQSGDRRTPEGRYLIDFRKADSQYHRSLHVSYPIAADREAARRRGVSPGGDIFVHGLPNGMQDRERPRLASDWTWGCIAVTNAEIEEIWRLVPNGTPIEIRP